jgi:hypothetical protein
MANEIFYELGTTGATVYAVVRNAAGQAWNGSAFVTYTTTRSTFWLQLPEVGVTGYYGPISLPGSGAGRWWQIYLQDSGTSAGASSHANDLRLATGYNDDSLTTLSILTTDNPISQRPVAEEFTARIPKRSSGSLVTTIPVRIKSSEVVTLAADFSWLLAPGDRLSAITDVSTTNSEALTLTSLGVDRELAKFSVEGGVANIVYTVVVVVTTVFGSTLEGHLSISYTT